LFSSIRVFAYSRSPFWQTVMRSIFFLPLCFPKG
jgi:hypothetical protein